MDYREFSSADQKEILTNEIRRLETEHFGLVHGFSAVPHAVPHPVNEDVDPEMVVTHFREERLPEVETELGKLYAQLDELDDKV